MNKLALVLVAGLGVVGFTGAALAQSSAMSTDAAPGAGAAVFSDADTDHDGFVSFPEAQFVYPTLTQDQFATADANHDDKLDATEYGTLGGVGSMGTSGTASAAPSAQ